MTATVLLAVTTAFASKTKKKLGIEAFWKVDSTYCVGSLTVQSACSKDFTGPVCTIADSNNNDPAYYIGIDAIPCTVLLRQL